MKKKIVLVLGLVALLTACGTSKSKTVDDQTYKIEKAVEGSGVGNIQVDGNVEANETKKVFVDKRLKVKEVFVKEGDYVEKGQLLMTFDESDRNTLMRSLEKEQLNLSKLQRDYNVQKELNKIGGSSDNTVKDLAAQIRNSILSIDGLKEDLSKTAENVESPVSGTITSLTAQENYSVNTDDPLLEIADLSDMKIVLLVPEYNVTQLKLGQKIVLKPEVFEKKREFPGVITNISKISQVNKSTSENVLEVEVKPEKEIPFIVPGFKVGATIFIGGDEKGISVPRTAVVTENDKYYVFVISTEGVLDKREIKYSEMQGNRLLVTDGVKNGEQYLTAPKDSMKTGDKVKFELETRKPGAGTGTGPGSGGVPGLRTSGGGGSGQ